MKQRSGLASLALVLLTGCTAPSESEASAAAALPPRPWTRAFLEPAVLVADEIRIEGPDDLLAHFASQQDPTITKYSSRTTSDGLLQETVMQPGVGGAEITAQIDGWELHALRRLVVLQRFVPDAPVTVRASGNAWWASASGGGERRDALLVFRGERGE